MKMHECLGPLMRGIGLTVVLIGTVAGAVQSRMHSVARQALHRSTTLEAGHGTGTSRESSIEGLTREVEDLRDSIEEETIVEDVLTNRWFDTLAIIGSTITATSFYVEWYCKRPKPVSREATG